MGTFDEEAAEGEGEEEEDEGEEEEEEAKNEERIQILSGFWSDRTSGRRPSAPLAGRRQARSARVFV